MYLNTHARAPNAEMLGQVRNCRRFLDV
jgi:hypothetical protein